MNTVEYWKCTLLLGTLKASVSTEVFLFMASVYILFSKKLNRFYTGSCLDLLQRLQSHKDKSFMDSFTSKTEDWELFFTINELDYKQSRLIELHIKKMKSVIYIKNLKQYPELLAKLIERYR